MSWASLALDEQMSVGRCGRMGKEERGKGKKETPVQGRLLLSDLAPHKRSDRLTFTYGISVVSIANISSSSDLHFPC